MIAVQIILIAIGALLADADQCSCRCNKQDVCEEQKALTTEIYNNTDEIQKWSRYYNLVKGLAEDFEYQVEHFMRQQLEVEINKTVEGLRNASQMEVTKQNMMARMESLENSVRALHEQADELDWTMKMHSEEMSGIRTELLPSCSPACENGGQCSQNNVCNCTSLFYGERCQDGPKCGIDFNNDGNNDRGNINSVLVWPWMAAVYRNSTSGTEYVCGGSVIHRHFVVTSASCMEWYGSAGLSVKLGLSDLKQGTHLQEHRVQSTHRHPQYKTGRGYNRDYDIALLELKEPISFGPFVRPVCLPTLEIPQGEPFYEPQSTAKTVRLNEYISSPLTASPTVLNFTVLPEVECRRKKKGMDWAKSFPSPDHHFCAEKSSTTSCPNVGSPLMESRMAGHVSRTWTQVGISWCYGNYTFSPRLDHLRAWVDATIAA